MDQRPIVFIRFNGDGKEVFNDIYMIDPDGSNEVPLTVNPGPDGTYTDNTSPRYNCDRSMIAFVSTKNNSRKLYNIFLMDLATRKTAQITTGNLNISSVDWSPEGIVFSSNCDWESAESLANLYRMSASGELQQ